VDSPPRLLHRRMPDAFFFWWSAPGTCAQPAPVGGRGDDFPPNPVRHRDPRRKRDLAAWPMPNEELDRVVRRPAGTPPEIRTSCFWGVSCPFGGDQAGHLAKAAERSHPPARPALRVGELFRAAASGHLHPGGGRAPQCPGAPAPPLRRRTNCCWSAPWPMAVRKTACFNPVRSAWDGPCGAACRRRQSTDLPSVGAGTSLLLAQPFLSGHRFAPLERRAARRLPSPYPLAFEGSRAWHGRRRCGLR